MIPPFPGRGYLNLSLLYVGIFERRPERKRLRPLFFPRYTCAVRLEIMMDINGVASPPRKKINTSNVAMSSPVSKK